MIVDWLGLPLDLGNLHLRDAEQLSDALRARVGIFKQAANLMHQLSAGHGHLPVISRAEELGMRPAGLEPTGGLD